MAYFPCVPKKSFFTSHLQIPIILRKCLPRGNLKNLNKCYKQQFKVQFCPPNGTLLRRHASSSSISNVIELKRN